MIICISVITFSNILKRRLRRSIGCLAYSLSKVILLGWDRLELFAFIMLILNFMMRSITLGVVIDVNVGI